MSFELSDPEFKIQHSKFIIFSEYQHRVAVAVKAILLADRLIVGAAHEIEAHESGDHGDRRRAGKMKIGNERVDDAKTEPGRDEKPRDPGVRFDSAFPLRDPFERARARRADGDDPAAARSEEHTSELQSRVDISYAVFC